MELKKRFPEVHWVPFEYRRSKNQTHFSPGNSPLCRNPSSTRAILSGKTLLQRAVELRRRSLILSRCLPVVEMALWRRAPKVYFHHAGANCSTGNPPPRGNPGLKRTRTDDILKKIDRKMNFKLKTKHPLGSYELQIYPITPSAAFPNLVRLSFQKSTQMSSHAHTYASIRIIYYKLTV
jgi:hypothetical protein